MNPTAMTRKQQAELGRKARALMHNSVAREALSEWLDRLKRTGSPLWRPGAEIHVTVAQHDAAQQFEDELRVGAPDLFRLMRREALDREEMRQQLRNSQETTDVSE